jgi:hypothetical protein
MIIYYVCQINKHLDESCVDRPVVEYSNTVLLVTVSDDRASRESNSLTKSEI